MMCRQAVSRPLWFALLCGAVACSWALPGRADLHHDLVAYYPLDFDASDHSGHGNHAVPLGSPVLVPGVRGSAIGFDGVDDVLQTPRSIEGDFSVAFWINTSAVAPTGTDWWQGFGLVDGETCGSPPGGDWGIALLNGGEVVWGSSAHLSSGVINDGLWHAVVVVREMTTGGVTLWVDGVVEASGVASPAAPLTGPDWIGVGNNPCDTGFGRLFLPGAIDEVRYYQRPLSDAEAKALADDWIHLDGFETGDLSAWSP